MYVLLILQKDKDKRSRLYYIAEIQRRRQLDMDVLEGNSIPKGLIQDLEAIGGTTPPVPDEINKLVINDIKEIDQLFAQPEFKSINELYITKKGKRRELEWYKALGLDSLWSVAKAVRKEGEYKLIYNTGSRAMHAQSYADQFEVIDGVSYLKPVRHLNHAHEVVDAVIVMGLHIYSEVIKEYFPQLHDDFMALFHNDWRPYLFNGKRLTSLYKSVG